MAKILAIGLAALDIINTVEDYPEEDAKVRALNQRVCRGGNTANTLVVLSQLGHHCSWGGVCVDEPDGQFILDDLAHYNIDTTPCKIEYDGKVPTSYAVVNQKNASRTIVHYRDCPEFQFSDFQRIDLQPFDWLHFEGRDVSQIALMLERVKHLYPTLPISLEIEKPRPHIQDLFTLVDVLLFSRPFVQDQGYSDAASFLQSIQHQLPNAKKVCAWGEEGGYALDKQGVLLHSPAYPPTQVVDTLGAGDTFNAGIIHSLCHNTDLATALNQACQLAGKKCGQIGFKGLTLLEQ
jgi:ketohexokinase